MVVAVVAGSSSRAEAGNSVFQQEFCKEVLQVSGEFAVAAYAASAAALSAKGSTA